MTKQERECRRDKVQALYEQGKSINQIAQEIKIDWSTVKRDLISRKIEIQTKRNQYSRKENKNRKVVLHFVSGF